LTFVDIESLQHRLPALRQEWHNPNSRCVLAVDDVLRPAEVEKLWCAFPEPSWDGWDLINDSLQFRKLSCERIEMFPPVLASLVHELNSSPMVRFLEALIDVQALLPDPQLWGGGLHCMEHGGYLWPHTDFLQGKEANLKRTVNLILFVHPNWTTGMGGNFELWDGHQLLRSVSPKPGRCVIFRTDSRSIHAVSRINGTQPRRSIALFYYSVMMKPDLSVDYMTGWRLGLTPTGSSVPRWKRFAASLLMRGSFGLKRAAIFLNRKAEEVVNSNR
jgi:hypothetical protein